MAVDIDECAENTDGCAHTCTNSIGSYSCSCQSGYRLASNGLWCTGERKAALIPLQNHDTKPNLPDVNECAEETDSCQQRCSNTMGSYSCDCHPGYKLASNGLTCNDIDECSENINGCAQNCTNTQGSYTCSCRPGYSLASDDHGCMGKIRKPLIRQYLI